MNSTILQDLLKQYEQKRIAHEKDLEFKKLDLYKSCPRLEAIDLELSNISINTAKSILNSNKNQIYSLKDNIEKLKKEKSELLKSLGKKPDYLTVCCDCPICKDTGYVLENNYSVMCKCLKQKLYDIEYNKSKFNIIKNQNFDNFNLNLYSNEVNKEKYGVNISPRANAENIKKASINFVENFDNFNTKNLLFSGGTGLGKTYLSNAIITALLEKGKTALYQTAPVMLDKIISDIFSKDGNSEFSESLLNVDLLIIDDLGTETMNSMKFTELYKIINTRLLNQNGKPTKTVISTNLDLQGLFNTYDERIVSRFVGYYDRFRFFGDDIRFKKIPV